MDHSHHSGGAPEQDTEISGWRAAGAAMRQVVMKSQRTQPSQHAGTPKLCKLLRRRQRDQEQTAPKEATQDDPMNEMLDDFDRQQSASQTSPKKTEVSIAINRCADAQREASHSLSTVTDRIREIAGHILPKSKRSARFARKSFAMRRTRSLGTEEDISVSSDTDTGPKPHNRRKLRAKPKKSTLEAPKTRSCRTSPVKDSSPGSRVEDLRRSLRLEASKPHPASVSNRSKLKLIGTQSLDLHDSCIPDIEDVFSADSGSSSTSLEELMLKVAALDAPAASTSPRGRGAASHRAPSPGNRVMAGLGAAGRGGPKSRRDFYLTETDSVPNLADIDTSGTEDTPGLETDDDAACNLLSERVAQLKQRRSPHSQPATGRGVEDVTFSRGLEDVTSERGPPNSSSWSDDLNLKCAGTGAKPTSDESFEGDFANLDISHPHPGHDCDIQLDSQALLELESSPSDGDAEADDEFECDCPVCQQTRGPLSTSDTVRSLDDRGAIREFSVDLVMDSWNPMEALSAEAGGDSDVLQNLFQNVIMQMLTVHPDLLGAEAPPPASPDTIKNLSVITVNQTMIDRESQCSVCLCTFVLNDEARRLPCEHSFHSVCIQMWLQKSGTCPVCRYVL